MSPLLFNVITADIAQAIKALDSKVTLYMYADDMVLCSKAQKNVQANIFLKH
jgi:ketosteroid isomerase-like protein